MNVSFVHRGGAQMASYRYRCATPALELFAHINKPDANVLIFCKPAVQEVYDAEKAKARGASIIVDFCDDHFDWSHYQEFLKIAHRITCPTKAMQKRILNLGYGATVIPDPYLYPEQEPHCENDSLLWFGHGSNFASVMPHLSLPNLRVVSNLHGCIPWSDDVTRAELTRASIVLMPATKDYKSPNRTLEAIRMGCFVAADPHPALEELPVWKDGVQEGVEWALKNRDQANRMVREAQNFIRERYSPKTVGAAWKRLVESVSTSVPAAFTGPVGLAVT